MFTVGLSSLVCLCPTSNFEHMLVVHMLVEHMLVEHMSLNVLRLGLT